jgi:hypothetical protein
MAGDGNITSPMIGAFPQGQPTTVENTVIRNRLQELTTGGFEGRRRLLPGD